MEWNFCYGDGNCWATWFWSGSTAAWVQALLTIWVFRWSMNSTREANERDQQKTREIFEHEARLQRKQAKESEALAFSLFERERDMNREQADIATFKERRSEKTRVFMNFIKAKYISDRMVAKTRTISVMFEKFGGLVDVAIKDAIDELTFDNNLLRETLMLDLPEIEVMDLISFQVVAINGYVGILKALAQSPSSGKAEHFENALKTVLEYDQKMRDSEIKWRRILEVE